MQSSSAAGSGRSYSPKVPSSPMDESKTLTIPGLESMVITTNFNTPIKGEIEARRDTISSYKISNSPKMRRQGNSGGSVDNFDEPLEAELVATRPRRQSKIALYSVRDSPPLHAPTSKDNGGKFDEPLEIELINPLERKISSYDVRDSPRIASKKQSLLNFDEPLDVEVNDPHKKIPSYKSENSPRTLSSRRSSRGLDDVPVYDNEHSRISLYSADENSPKPTRRYPPHHHHQDESFTAVERTHSGHSIQSDHNSRNSTGSVLDFRRIGKVIPSDSKCSSAEIDHSRVYELRQPTASGCCFLRSKK